MSGIPGYNSGMHSPKVVLRVTRSSKAKADSTVAPEPSPSTPPPRKPRAPTEPKAVSINAALRANATALLIECIHLIVLRASPREGLEKDLHEVLSQLLDAPALEIHPSARRLNSVQELKDCVAPWLWEAAREMSVLKTLHESGLESVLGMIFFYWFTASARSEATAENLASQLFGETPTPDDNASASISGRQELIPLDGRLTQDVDPCSEDDGSVSGEDSHVVDDGLAHSASAGSTDSYQRLVAKHAPGQRPSFIPDYLVYLKLRDGSKKPVLCVECKHSKGNPEDQVNRYFDEFAHERDLHCMAARIAPKTQGPGIQVVLYRRDHTKAQFPGHPPPVIRMHPGGGKRKKWYLLTDDDFLEQIRVLRNDFGDWPEDDENVRVSRPS
ncbi:uncharacterized protein BXZ73DRAFT_111631 [Epithele typhae]|uniref:uncharacterized protein n=1 Tax=Epithele typhae TaxID=378194 RepID=UPI002007FD84|nr:uncharacterized protein BXZ73DRAFT_111631 [Epithele typhae]KAH9900050.1 hypothetical protein BXZ73DRAFT_111631 [Epithele typhae]